MSMGQRVIFERKKHGWTAATLANKARLTQNVVHYIEQGVRHENRIEVGTAKKLAKALGVTLDYLCGMYDEAEANVQP
jgi:transcriptional regulator with XRE-family HTH domain